MGKRSTPAPDPGIAQAAAASAANGAEYLNFMKSQAAITNGWAAEDRARYTNTFQPMQDKFIADAQEWDSPERMAARVDQNRGAVASNIATGQQIRCIQVVQLAHGRDGQ